MEKEPKISVEQMNEEARKRLVTGLEGHGAHLSFDDAVQDFPERLMNEKPSHVPYTFWHQLEHILRTQEDMINYIQNQEYVSPEWPGAYWPGQDEKTDRAGWEKTIQKYHESCGRFIRLVKDPKTNLLAPVKHMKNQSILRSALIIIDHTAYHLGEFVMGRQILGAWKSELE